MRGPRHSEVGGANVLTGMVTARALQGAFTELHLDVGGTDVRVHLHGGAPHIGQPMRFTLPTEALWSFSDVAA